jgi:predicted RNase H-like nuclease (RuvC/YqgF family)
LADSANPDSDLDYHFDPISDFLRDIERLTEENDDLQPRIHELEDELSETKASVKSSKSDDDAPSFWDRVVPSKVRDSASFGRFSLMLTNNLMQKIKGSGDE